MRGKRTGRFGVAWSLVLPALLLLAVGQGCELPDPVTLPENAPRSQVWKMNFGPRAINMAVGEEVQLTFDPRTIDGTAIPLAELPPIEVTTSNPEVTVDENWKLTAERAASSVIITAKMVNLEGEFWTLTEQVRVKVEAAPYEVPAFQVGMSLPSPVPANRNAGVSAFVVPTATPEDTIWPLASYTTDALPSVYYMSVPSWDDGSNRGMGRAKVVASAYIFGTMYTDSVSFDITYPDSTSLTIWRASNNLNPSPSMMARTDQTILKGGKVTFINSNPTMNSDIVFDDQVNVVGGNIPVVPANPGKAVVFPNTGKFTYKSSHGFGGTITVVDWPAQP